MADPQQPVSTLVKCVSCAISCYNRRYQRRRRHIRPADNNRVSECAQLKPFRFFEPEDKLSPALDVPFENLSYCYDCFTTLEHFFNDLLDWHEDHFSGKKDTFIHGNSKMDLETPEDEEELPDWLNDHSEDVNYWYKCFKNLDYFFRTDTCLSMHSVVQDNHTRQEFIPRIMFESIAKQRPEFPIKVRIICLSLPVPFCAACNISFESVKEVEEHNEDKHGGPPVNHRYDSSVDESSDNSSDLLKSTATPKSSWYCSFCEMPYDTEEEVDEHNKDRHGRLSRFYLEHARETNTCICNETLDSPQELTRHVLEHETSYVFKRLPALAWYCTDCGRIVNTQSELGDHFRWYHPETKQASQASFTVPRLGAWYCSVCEEGFKSQHEVDVHNESEHKGQSVFIAHRARLTHTCLTCNRRFNTQTELENHASSSKHMQPLPSPIDLQIRRDPIAFKNALRLEYESRFLSEDDPEFLFSCLGCKETFKSLQGLEDHDANEHNIFPGTPESTAVADSSYVNAASCRICGILKPTRDDIEVHGIRSHEDPAVCIVVRGFSCNVCRKVFKAKRSVATHIANVHNAPRGPPVMHDIKCTECDIDKRFSEQGLRAHKNDKHNPQICVCGWNYPGLASLKAHQQRCYLAGRVHSQKVKPTPEQLEGPAIVKQRGPVLPYWGDRRLDVSKYESVVELEFDSEEGSEDESERESKGDSKGDSKDDSEGDSKGDSEGESESDEDEDDEDSKWPEEGELGRIPCLFRRDGCGKVFHKASLMIQHHEFHDCIFDEAPDLYQIFNDEMEESSRKLYDKRCRIFRCPNCDNEGGGRFRFLTHLVAHAESSACDLKVRTGPLRDVEYSLLCWAEKTSRLRRRYGSRVLLKPSEG
ncbi:hypothetical protein FPOA_00238 [Fusarium poae]|uniref:C2H2-type domain-containing protein n=1 Tax=Fusarium poae TaxID=36050 RepID=A0A1B8B0N0_FUSPO|nr:hypothetical protein FPOA_00238 [Fusarium poae]